MRRGNRSHLSSTATQRLNTWLKASLTVAGVCLLALVLFYSQPGETLVQGPQVRVIKTPASGPAFAEAPELVQARAALARLSQKKHPDAATESEIDRLRNQIRLHQSIGDVKSRLQEATFTSAGLRQAYEEKLTRMEAELSLSTQ